MNSWPSVEDRMRAAGGPTRGFDYLRLILASGVLVLHCFNAGGDATAELAVWEGSLRFLPAIILPMFFALSGFLVAASLERSTLFQFLALRALRVIPALAVAVTLSALGVGLLLTSLPRGEYLLHPELREYFLNIIGVPRYYLPGVFEHDGGRGPVNGQLWTIVLELECYVVLAALSLFMITRSPTAMAVMTLFLIVGMTVASLTIWPVAVIDNVPGRALILSFFAGATIHFNRKRIPYSPVLGGVAAVLAVALLNIPSMIFVAILPVAYLTVWLGMFQLPKIPFGDLSYGVYLFHFPIEYGFADLFPQYATFWTVLLVAAPIAFFCAFLSWNLVEKPILARKWSLIKGAEAFLGRIAPTRS